MGGQCQYAERILRGRQSALLPLGGQRAGEPRVVGHWQKTEFVSLDLKGLTLDDAWQNFVSSIGCLDAQAEETIEEQIINREQREKLLRQIEALEKQCRIEKQTRKKYELHQEIQKLRIKIKQV